MIIQNQGDKHFETLLALYLKQSQANKNSNHNQLHLDEDILSAFVEGAVTENQAVPVLKHLIHCAFCRRITTQLAELSENFAEIPVSTSSVKTNSWGELWNNLTESVSRSYDNSVVAHENKEPDEKPEKEICDR